MNFVENFFLPDQNELSQEINDSDILAWSKEYLQKRLKQISEDGLDSGEVKLIREMINKYDKLENSYTQLINSIKKETKNIIRTNKVTWYIPRTDWSSYPNESVDFEEIEANKYTNNIEKYLNGLTYEELTTLDIDSYMKNKEEYLVELDKINWTLRNIIYFLSDAWTKIEDIFYNNLSEKFLTNMDGLKNYWISSIEILLKETSILIKNTIEKKKWDKIKNLAIELNYGWKYIYSLEELYNSWKDEIIYSDVLEEYWLPPESSKIIMEGIYKYLENKTVTINKKKITFTESFIKENEDFFMENLKDFMIYVMRIESYWWKLDVKNKKWSSAKWPLQWIDWWKNWKKHSKYNRKKWNYSPFETALRRTDMFYNNWDFSNFQSNKTPDYIKQAWSNNWKLNLDDFWVDKQISLWFTDLIMRDWKAKEYLMWVLLKNKWSFKKLYEKIHHTDSKWQTKINATKYLAQI